MVMGTVLKVVFTWMPPHGLERVQECLDGIEVRATEDRREMPALLSDAEVACVGEFDAELLAASRRLRWVQALSGGVNEVLFPELVSSLIPLTCCKECFAIPGAEHALAMMLAFSRRLEYDLRQRPERAFEYTDPEELAGKTAGIIGMGNIGVEIARLCHCFGMQVIGMARRPRACPSGVTEMITPERLPHLLGVSDFVIVTVPLTPATGGMIGARELAQMQPTAYLIDVSGRPALYDLNALESALRRRQIAGAALQIVPPKESPLWNLENLLISFHRATSRQEYDRCFELFCDNLRRYQRGQPLRGLVDKEAGY